MLSSSEDKCEVIDMAGRRSVRGFADRDGELYVSYFTNASWRLCVGGALK